MNQPKRIGIITTRRAGKSTAHILATIAHAIENPGKWVPYRDHAAYLAPDATRYHLSTFKQFIARLELDMEVRYRAKLVEVRSNHYGIEVKE